MQWKQQALQPLRFANCDDRMRRWFELFSRLPSCCDAGTAALKFSKWCSIEQCWELLRQEWFLFGIVLNSASKDHGLEEAQEATHVWDTAAEQLTAARKGLLNKVPKYVTLEVATLMDAYVLLVKPFTQFHQYRTAEVKTPEEHIAHAQQLRGGAWMDQILELVGLLADPCRLDAVYNIGGVTHDTLTELFQGLVVNLTGEFVMREMPRVMDHPHADIAMLNPEAEDECRAVAASDWAAVVAAEAEARVDANMALHRRYPLAPSRSAKVGDGACGA